MVDTKDLKSFAFGRAGSSPALGTKFCEAKQVKDRDSAEDRERNGFRHSRARHENPCHQTIPIPGSPYCTFDSKSTQNCRKEINSL